MKRSVLLLVSSIPLLLATLWSSTAGAVVTGSGTIVTEERVLDPFNSVEIIGSFEIVYEPGSPGAKITADDNIVPLIKTQVRPGGVLAVFASESFRTATIPQIVISSEELRSYKGQGSGKATLQLPAGTTPFALTQNGSGRIDVSGEGVRDRFALSLTGSGEIDASALVAKWVDVMSLGSGRSIVNATERLKARIQGSGSIRYLGNPPLVIRTILGSGSILPY